MSYKQHKYITHLIAPNGLAQPTPIVDRMILLLTAGQNSRWYRCVKKPEYSNSTQDYLVLEELSVDGLMALILSLPSYEGHVYMDRVVCKSTEDEEVIETYEDLTSHLVKLQGLCYLHLYTRNITRAVKYAFSPS